MRIPLLLFSFFTISACQVIPQNNYPDPSVKPAWWIEEKKASKPKWKPLVEGSTVSANTNYAYHPKEMKLSNGAILRGKAWNTYLKEFVEFYPVTSRHAVLDGVTRYYTNFDKVEKIIRIEPLRYMSEPYSRASYVSVIGRFSESDTKLYLKLKHYAKSWLFAKKVKIIADDYTWESPELKFLRDNSGGNIWEYTNLDLDNKDHLELASKIADSKESIVRFYGKQYYSDLTVSERMKNDLKAILLSFRAIKSKNESLGTI